MQKWTRFFSFLLILGLISGYKQPVYAAPPPPLQEESTVAAPAPEVIDPDLVKALDQNINRVSKSADGVLALIIFDPYIDHVVYSEDGQTALLWLGLIDPDTALPLATEPGLAIAKINSNQKALLDGSANWDITLQADSNWQEKFSSLPKELITEDLLTRFQTPADVISKDLKTTYSGYKLPWAGGTGRFLTGSIGHFLIYYSCSETACRYAYDFADGTMYPLLAARGGTVYRYNTTCPNYSTACTNYVVLKDESTSPTTYQLYYHMAYDSTPQALRSEGAIVLQGQYIGKVDDTGASTGHHLHFHVFTTATNFWGGSVDVRFDDVAINGGTPRTCYEATTWPAYGTECLRNVMLDGVNKGDNFFISGNRGTNPPSGGLILPAHGEDLTDTGLLVGGWANDDLGIQNIQIMARPKGEDWKVIKNGLTTTNGSFLTEINVCDAGLLAGPVDIYARIFDYEGNQAANYPGLRTIINNAGCRQLQPPACVPNDYQVALYSDPNYQGSCSIFGVGPYHDGAHLGNLGDNNVESLLVGANVRALLYGTPQSNDSFSSGGRSEAIESNDANLLDNRINNNYTSAMLVQDKTKTPLGVSINTIFNNNTRDLFANESYVIDFVGYGVVDFRAELTGPVNKSLSWTKQPGWSIGSLPAGNYTVQVWGRNSAGDQTATKTFTINAASLSNNTAVTAPVTFDFQSGAQNWAAVPMWYLTNVDLAGRQSQVFLFNDLYDSAIGSGNLGDPHIGGGDLTSPPIVIPASGYYLRFDYYFGTESFMTFWDHRWLQISVDGGRFENLLQLSLDADSTWLSSKAVNLSAYAGKTVRLRFHMDIVDQFENGGYGWLVDNITINTTAPVSCNDPEPNNSIAQATAFPQSGEQYAFICPNGDLDFYHFAATAGQQFVLDVDAKDFGSPLDPYLFLYDSQGNLLAENDDVEYSVQRDSLILFSAPKNDNYYAMVKAWNHPKVGDSTYFYTLKIFDGDLTAPEITFISPSDAYLPSTEFSLSVNAFDAGIGMQKVDFFWHSPDILNGTWISLGSDSDGSDGWTAPFNPVGYTPVEGSLLYAHAYDNNNNQRGKLLIIQGYDLGTPTSQLNPLPPTSATTLIKLSWSGSDPQGLLKSYDLQVQVNNGTWQDLTTDIPATQTSMDFLGQTGTTYGFRLRAVDASNNREDYPSTAEAITAVQTCSTDNYESDDNLSSKAANLPLSVSQNHNFCPANDVDWVKMDVTAGTRYMIVAASKGGGASMNLRLYAANQTTLLVEKLATAFSQSNTILYNPTVSQTLYLQITPFDNRLAGDDVKYTTLYAVEIPFYLPIINR